MSKERASLGFGQELDELDQNTWAPKPSTAKPRPPRKDLVQATEEAGFQSREPQPIRQQRRARRTGRTEQFTTKTTPDYRTLIYDIADGKIDGQQRLVGEVLEQAVDALIREIAPKRAG